jgi:hypothetical protein
MKYISLKPMAIHLNKNGTAYAISILHMWENSMLNCVSLRYTTHMLEEQVEIGEHTSWASIGKSKERGMNYSAGDGSFHNWKIWRRKLYLHLGLIWLSSFHNGRDKLPLCRESVWLSSTNYLAWLMRAFKMVENLIQTWSTDCDYTVNSMTFKEMS